MLDTFQPYSTALLCLMILVLVVSVQGFISIYVNLLKREGTPGKIVEGNHDESHWRTYRLHQNSLENFAPFAVTLLAGVLVGASAGWINTLAIIYLVARIAHWVIYAQGVGAVAAGPRTISYVVGFITNVVMALVVLFAVL